MRRLVYMAALALVATLGVAPGATAQQMNDDHMMDDGQMMDANMMASPSASATSASPSATASAPRGHHGGGGSSASATVGSRLPSTGGVPLVSLVSVGALVLLVGFGLAAARLLRRSI